MAVGIRLISLAIIVSILFFPVVVESTGGTAVNYTVTFHEVGLPNGANWSVSQGTSVKYSASTSINFTEPDGSYNFIMGKVNGYKPLPSNFTVNVQGHNTSFTVIYAPELYPVTFVETGLPPSTFWNVTLGNKTNTTSSSTAGFMVMNGTYNYTIANVGSIVPSTSSGTITVKGAPAKVFLKFTGPLNCTFFERGLPTGTKWSVWINGTYYNTTGSLITVTLLNGTYSYIVQVPSEYSASPSQGRVNYSNDLVYVNVTSLLYYEILIAILVVLIGVITTFYLRGIRKRRSKSRIEIEKK